MKDSKGKSLSQKHYKLLCELGIEIVIYDLKTYEDTDSSMHQPAPRVTYGFEICGGINEQVDFDELYELMLLLTIAKRSKVPAIKDAFEKLQTVIGISHE